MRDMINSSDEHEKTELLSRFVENLHSSDHDLFAGIEPGRLSRGDMDLLDLALFIAPVVEHRSSDYKTRLRVLATQVVRRSEDHGRLAKEHTARPLSQLFSPAVGFAFAVVAFLAALMAEPIPASLELRSIDTPGQSWYKLQAGTYARASLGGKAETHHGSSLADVFLGFRAVA